MMGSSVPPSSSETSLGQALDGQRATALDQLEAAWQLCIAGVEEQLAAGWRQHLAQVVEERFREISVHLEDAVAARLEERLAELRGELRRECGDRFNQSLRRIRSSETEAELYDNLIEAAGAFAPKSALLQVDGENLHPLGSRDAAAGGARELGEAGIPLGSAPALLGVVEARDTLIVERSATELAPALAEFFGDEGGKIGLFPVVSRERTVAILCEGGTNVEAEAGSLELLAAMAGLALDARVALSPPPPMATASAVSPLIPAGPPEIDWSALSQADRELHSRARRFARVQVAEIRFHKASAVQEGRLRGNLYAVLRKEIDASREAFRTNFAAAGAAMVDYLHLELVRTLAHDDKTLLGPEYPGPLA